MPPRSANQLDRDVELRLLPWAIPEREASRLGQWAQTRRLDGVIFGHAVYGERAAQDTHTAQLGRELRGVDAFGGFHAQCLGDVDDRYGRALGNSIADALVAGLLADVREQRRCVEHRDPHRSTFLLRFASALGSESRDGRSLAWAEFRRQTDAVLGRRTERKQAHGPVGLRL